MFEKKKIQIETLGEYLRQCRQSLGLSPEEVAKRCGIKLQFLGFLENSEAAKLPPDVYVLGFLRKLSNLYRIETQPLIDQYKKERGIAIQVKERRLNGLKPGRRFFGRLVITPKILSLAGAALFTVLTLSYIIYQVYSINRVPTLVIFEPQDRQKIKDSFVNVRGKTDPGMEVSINGQEIFVDSNGEFKTQLGITPGPRDLKIMARNKFDRQVVTAVSIVGESSAPAPAQAGLTLKLDFSADVSLTFAIDSGQSQTLSFHQGDSKTFDAERKIVIGTSDAGATKVTLNGNPLGALGRTHEALSNIPFFSEATSNSP